MTDPSMLRCPTILSALASHPSEIFVGVVTSKDKLRALLSKDLSATSSLSVSVERENKLRDTSSSSDALTLSGRQLLKGRYGVENVASLVGRAAPHVYDPDCSIYVRYHLGSQSSFLLSFLAFFSPLS
jgi:hypothetical protein